MPASFFTGDALRFFPASPLGDIFFAFIATFFLTTRVFLAATTFLALTATFFWILAFNTYFLAAGLAALAIALVFFSGCLGFTADDLVGDACFLAGDVFAWGTSDTLGLAWAAILFNISDYFLVALTSRFFGFSSTAAAFFTGDDGLTIEAGFLAGDLLTQAFLIGDLGFATGFFAGDFGFSATCFLTGDFGFSATCFTGDFGVSTAFFGGSAILWVLFCSSTGTTDFYRVWLLSGADTTGLAGLDSITLGLLSVVAGLGGATGTMLAFCFGSGLVIVFEDLLWRSSSTGAATILVSFASSFDAFLAGNFEGDSDFLAEFFTSLTGETVFTGETGLAGEIG